MRIEFIEFASKPGGRVDKAEDISNTGALEFAHLECSIDSNIFNNKYSES
jgi:hypothetical protein